MTQSQTVVLSNCDAVVLPTKRLPVLRCEAELEAAAPNCSGDEKCIQLASLPPPLISFCVSVAEEGTILLVLPEVSDRHAQITLFLPKTRDKTECDLNLQKKK